MLHARREGAVITNGENKTKAVSFTVITGNNEKYLITFQPQRHKNIRHLLLPLTVGLDAVTLPVQVLVGIVLFSKVPLM